MKKKEILLTESMKRLGWDDVLSILAGFALSDSGVHECLNLRPLRNFEEAESASLASAEMAVLLSAIPSIPHCNFNDILPFLEKSSKQITLEPGELKEIGNFTRLSERMTRYFKKKPWESIPNLFPIAETLKETPGLLKTIEAIISDDGELKDNASPELAKLKKQSHALRSTIIKKIEKILNSPLYAPHIRDKYFTERENRYVLPIRAESRSQFRGIVHGISGSGATLFLEPESLVDLNNSLKIAEMKIELEIGNILKKATREIALFENAFRVNFEILTQIDVIQAIARFGEKTGANYVKLSRTGDIYLRNARHPVLLVKKGEAVKGNTIEVKEKVRGVIISGPNTGGKTVALKMMGLMALMAASGLPLTVDPDSRTLFFSEVYADIGDEQNIHLNLSTFSAHLVNIIKIMKSADENSLVLLDELMVSTEPEEGAALAEAILIQFVEKTIKVIVTTHYNSLKALAQTRPDLLNIGFGFDIEKMAPTYRLTLGMPEKSSPLEIALRFGMDPEVMKLSSSLLKNNDRILDDLLSELREEKKQWEKGNAELRSLKQEVEDSAVEKRKMMEEIRLEKEIFHREKRKRLSREIAGAKEEIKEILRAFKSEPSGKMRAKAEAGLSSFSRSLIDSLPLEGGIPLESLEPGDMVEIPSLEAKGELLETPSEGKSVKLIIGNFISTVPSSLIRGYEKKNHKNKEIEKKNTSSVYLDVSFNHAFSEECNLRGLDASEAADKLARFLDAAILAEAPVVRIIHGIGKGVLKKKVMALLEDFPFSSTPHFRPGHPREGGQGVTIVDFMH